MFESKIVIFIISCLLIVHSLALKLISCNDTEYKLTQTGDYICKVNQNYDKSKVPGISPLILDSGIYIDGVTKVDETHNSITIHAYISFWWTDPDLSYIKNSE